MGFAPGIARFLPFHDAGLHAQSPAFGAHALFQRIARAFERGLLCGKAKFVLLIFGLSLGLRLLLREFPLGIPAHTTGVRAHDCERRFETLPLRGICSNELLKFALHHMSTVPSARWRMSKKSKKSNRCVFFEKT